MKKLNSPQPKLKTKIIPFKYKRLSYIILVALKREGKESSLRLYKIGALFYFVVSLELVAPFYFFYKPKLFPFRLMSKQHYKIAANGKLIIISIFF